MVSSAFYGAQGETVLAVQRCRALATAPINSSARSMSFPGKTMHPPKLSATSRLGTVGRHSKGWCFEDARTETLGKMI
jgi:hypothetical protein